MRQRTLAGALFSTETTLWFMMRLQRTQKSSISSPRRMSRIGLLAVHLGRAAGPGLRGEELRIGQRPLGRLETGILADSQMGILAFQEIAHVQRLTRFAQPAPGIVFVLRFHLAALLEILRPGGGGAGNVRRPAELLPWRILHAEDPIDRH